jgi:hypothetical protein
MTGVDFGTYHHTTPAESQAIRGYAEGGVLQALRFGSRTKTIEVVGNTGKWRSEKDCQMIGWRHLATYSHLCSDTSVKSSPCMRLVRLAFIRSHVAAAGVLRVGAGHTALVDLQQVALAVGTATRVSSINRWASRQ